MTAEAARATAFAPRVQGGTDEGLDDQVAEAGEAEGGHGQGNDAEPGGLLNAEGEPEIGAEGADEEGDEEGEMTKAPASIGAGDIHHACMLAPGGFRCPLRKRS